MNAHSLSTRIAFLLGISMVLVVGAAAVIMDQMVDTEMVQRFDDTLLTQARTLVALVSVDTASATMKNTRSPRDSVFRGETSGTFDIQCKNGDRISSDPGAPRYPGEWKAEATQEPIFDDVTVDEVTWRTVRYQFDALTQQNTGDTGKLSAATSVASRACTIVLMQPRTKLDEMLDTIDAILLLTPMAALIVVLLLSPRLVRRGLKPLALLAAQMRHVGPQAVEQRLTGTGTRELEPLIARFNEVLERMSDGMQRERQFASALAHETRTRLAELRALVDVEQLYPGERSTRELLDEVGNIGGELESIVSALLLLTRLDAGIESLQMRPVDLDEHVARQLQRIAATLHARNLQIDIRHANSDAALRADPSLLDIILGNLLANASHYCPEGGTIRIDRSENALVISNPAPDLEADEVQMFGRRHWSKHYGTSGHIGLGLTLASAAARAMQLQLQFSVDAKQQLRANLQWPDTPAPAA